jgi:glycosyltransferase involved in cell wall biosynthesis
LVILGDGPERERLRTLAAKLGLAKRIHLPGFVEFPETILAKSLSFVLASRWEGFGNVVVEALASGVPIIATDCPGAPKDILEGGSTAR